MTKKQIFKTLSIVLLILIVSGLIYQFITNHYRLKIQNAYQENKIWSDDFNKQQKENVDYQDNFSSLYNSGAYDSAIKFCLNYALNRPDRSEYAFHDIGLVYWAKQQRDSAVYYLTKAILKSDHFVGALANRGSIYYEMGAYSKAEQDFLRVTYYRSDYLFSLGIIQEKIDKKKAIDTYNLFISKNEDTLECVRRRDSLLTVIKNGL